MPCSSHFEQFKQLAPWWDYYQSPAYLEFEQFAQCKQDRDMDCKIKSESISYVKNSHSVDNNQASTSKASTRLPWIWTIRTVKTWERQSQRHRLKICLELRITVNFRPQVFDNGTLVRVLSEFNQKSSKSTAKTGDTYVSYSTLWARIANYGQE